MNHKTPKNMPEITYNKIEALLKDDGSKIRDQLIAAGLFLMVFESLKQEVITFVDDFLAVRYINKKGLVSYKRGDEFSNLIKKHNKKILVAALYWIHDLEGITTEDIKEIKRFINLRNDIGHELLQVFTSDKKPLITISDIKLVLDLYMKITRWSIEVDFRITNSHFNRKTDYDLEKAENIRILLLKKIVSSVGMW